MNKAAHPRRIPQGAKASCSSSRKINILLVDDREENLLALETVLKDLGHNLVRARSGKEALKNLLVQDFALILLDVFMPDMDGYETAELIRQRDRTKHTPIIFLTAVSKAEIHIQKGYAVGAVDYIFKPFVPEILRAKVATFVDLFDKTERIQEQATELKREVERRKHAQEQLSLQAKELARSNLELEQFAYIASHDLREPLRKVASFAQLLEAHCHGKLDEEARKYISYMVNGVTRMQAMISDLLEYSRVGREEKPWEKTDCAAVLEKVVSDLSAPIRESQALVSYGPMPTLDADPSQLARLFQNLIGNAIKFRGQHSPKVSITARRGGEEWLFTVEDNGIGIDPAYHDRIFALFKRLHTRDQYPGNGIGLAVCKRIVENHRGRIWVESAPGRGSAFRFTLPASPAERD